jgi:hypothetical protein
MGWGGHHITREQNGFVSKRFICENQELTAMKWVWLPAKQNKTAQNSEKLG